MAKKREGKRAEDDSRYHDTWRLLSRYRDVVWSVEISTQHLKKEFEREYECSVDDFLESVYMAGADLSGTQIESHARCIERSNKMLKLVNDAVDLLRNRHKYGETYYWVLYYTFLSPQQLKGVNEILEQLQPHLHDVSVPTYYRRRKKAVEALSSIMWGYSAQDCLDILEEFFPLED